MTEELYSPYKLAIELGFSEALARHYEELDLDATKLRQIAKAKDMPSMKPKLGKPKPEREPTPAEGRGKKHKHYYRKNGVCSCGAVRKVKAKATS